MLKTVDSQFNLQFDSDFSKGEVLTYQNISDKIYLILGAKEDKKELFENLKKDVQILYSQFIANNNAEISFENLIKELNEKYGKENGLDIILALSSGSNLYLTQSGVAECYLIRNGRLNIILESSVSQNEEGEAEKTLFENIASGIFSNDDFVIFSNKRILKRFTALEIVDFFEKGVSEGIESIEEVFENEEYSSSLIGIHVKTELNRKFGESENFPVNMENIVENLNKGVNFVQNKIDDFVVFLSKKTNNSYEKTQKMFISSVFLGIVFILIMFISFSSQGDQFEKEVYEEYKIEILKIEQNLEVAESRSLMGSNIEANAILDKSEEKLDEIFEKGILREKALELSNQILKMRDDINKITRVSDLETKKMVGFEDFLGEGENLKGFFELDGFVFAYTENKIFKTSLNKMEESFEFIEGEKIKTIESAEDIGLGIIVSESNNLYTFDGKKIEKEEFAMGEELKNFVDIETYSKYFYLLDSGTKTSEKTGTGEVKKEVVTDIGHIWKYGKKYEGFSLPTDYLEGENLNDALSLAIDGSVYVLRKDGLISQYYSGKPVNFNLKGSSEIFKDAEKIYTEPDFGKIYLQDFKNNKIILIQKTNNGGEFLRQYIFENEKILDFKTDINEQEMIILGEKNIYKISLMGL